MSPVDWDSRRLQMLMYRGVRPPRQECSGYVIKQSRPGSGFRDLGIENYPVISIASWFTLTRSVTI